MTTPMLQIKDLSISFAQEKESVQVVAPLQLSIAQNEIIGLVGESGSGKSVTSLAIMGLLDKRKANITGEVLLNEENILQYSDKEWEAIRAKKIGMIFQEPMSALNPTMTCGTQVLEVLMQHVPMDKAAAKKRVLEVFAQVKLPRAEAMYAQYPHQLSGGQKQRVMIAMAIICKPQLLIADEPTTALDVTVQKEIIALLLEIQKETQMSILFISHDLALVSEIANRVVVLYKGKVVEKGKTEDIFQHPKENYTKALLYAKPNTAFRYTVLPTVDSFVSNTFKGEKESLSARKERQGRLYAQAPILEIKNLQTYYGAKASFWSKNTLVKAVDSVSFSMYPGETVGLVGESGCGKSTLGRSILGLESPQAGAIYYQGKDILQLRKSERKQLRKEIQIIFQDPFSSLNPRIPIGEAIMEPMLVHGIEKTKKGRKKRCMELLEKVGLDPSYFNRYPHEFSGGQRQRIGIARTLALAPKVIICDESVAALDVSVQAQVLNLLNSLKEELGFSYLFISHDLSVVKYLSDQVLVMNNGKIVERGEADALYENPQEAYTKTLIAAVPGSKAKK